MPQLLQIIHHQHQDVLEVQQLLEQLGALILFLNLWHSIQLCLLPLHKKDALNSSFIISNIWWVQILLLMEQLLILSQVYIPHLQELVLNNTLRLLLLLVLTQQLKELPMNSIKIHLQTMFSVELLFTLQDRLAQNKFFFIQTSHILLNSLF